MKPIAHACPGASWPKALAGIALELSLDQLGSRLASSDSVCLLAYTHPLVALADSISASQPSDPLEFLTEWQVEAQAMLAMKQAHPERCRLVNLPLLDAAAWSALAREIGLSEPRAQELAKGHQIQDLSALDPRLLMAFQHHGQLLDTYADLEGWADLFDREPQFRLPLPPWQSPDFANLCLASWQRDQAEVATETHKLRQGRDQARKEAELSLLQWHQVEEDKKALYQEVEAQRQEIESLGQARDEAKEEAELTLLQLHQVQEELEHYFLLCRGQASQLDHYDVLQQRCQHLLAQSGPVRSPR